MCRLFPYIEGNRISKTNSTNRELYEWDYRNRLTSVTQQTYNAETETWITTQTIEYAYDYNNVWIRKINGSDKTIFIPENYQTVIQIDNNTITHHYLWTPNTQDKLLADVTNTEILWSLTDHLGTIRDIIQSTTTGIVTQAHIIYDAYGNIISCKNSENQTVDNPLLFAYTGKAFDVSTQLQNNINRWYDPTTGRWLSTDPISFVGNDTNLYRYCSNMPLVGLDFQGEWFHVGIGALVGGVVAGISSVVSDIHAGREIDGSKLMMDVILGATSGAVAAGTGNVMLCIGTRVKKLAPIAKITNRVIAESTVGGAVDGAVNGGIEAHREVQNNPALTLEQKRKIIATGAIAGAVQGGSIGAVTGKYIDVPINKALSKTHLITDKKWVPKGSKKNSVRLEPVLVPVSDTAVGDFLTAEANEITSSIIEYPIDIVKDKLPKKPEACPRGGY